MRKLFLVIALAFLTALAAGCMSDEGDQSDRRLAAAGVQEPIGWGYARLSLGTLETNWASFTWGVGADVIESRATDAEGQPIYRLSAGATRPGTLTVERGVTTESAQLAALFTSGQLEFKQATLTLYANDASQLGTYTLAGVVVADLKHRSNEGAILETLTLRFTSASLQF